MKIFSSCLIHSHKSNICSTDCVYHSKMNCSDIETISEMKSLPAFKDYRMPHEQVRNGSELITKTIKSMDSVKLVGPFITTYSGNLKSQGFRADKYFNFARKDKHKAANKILTNLNAYDVLIDIISKPLCDFTDTMYRDGVVDNADGLQLQEGILDELNKYKRTIKLKNGEFLILPVENYFFKVNSNAKLHILHGYYVPGEK